MPRLPKARNAAESGCKRDDSTRPRGRGVTFCRGGWDCSELAVQSSESGSRGLAGAFCHSHVGSGRGLATRSPQGDAGSSQSRTGPHPPRSALTRLGGGGPPHLHRFLAIPELERRPASGAELEGRRGIAAIHCHVTSYARCWRGARAPRGRPRLPTIPSIHHSIGPPVATARGGACLPGRRRSCGGRWDAT
jgi:hypothetical protein